jgi:hypothetical protein
MREISPLLTLEHQLPHCPKFRRIRVSKFGDFLDGNQRIKNILVGLQEREGESKIYKSDLWFVRNVRENRRIRVSKFGDFLDGNQRIENILVGLQEREGESKIYKSDLWFVRNVRERGR